MAVAPVVTQLYIDGAWTSYDSLEGESCTVQIGSDVESGTRPNKVVFSLKSDDLSMDPSNPESSLHGKIGRNTPARVLLDGDTLVVGEASAWQPEATPEHAPGTGRGLSWVTLTAEGPLRRLGRWDDPLDSPMLRQISSYSSLTGYWPMEGGTSDTTQLSEASGAQGATAGTIAGSVTMAGDPGPGGGGTALVMGTGATIGGRFKRHLHSGWQFVFHFKLAAAPSSASYANLYQLRLSNASVIDFQINDTNFRVLITGGDGSSLLSSASGHGIDVTDWVRLRLKVSVSGGTVSVEPAWYAQDAGSVVGWTATYGASSTGALLSWAASTNTWTDGAAYGHVFAVTDTSLNLTSSYDAAGNFNGYRGERAGARFLRLCSEQGISRWIVGASADTAPMGRQKPERLLDLLEECMRTDGALIYDDPADSSGTPMLAFRTRVHRQQQSVKLALVKTTNVAPPLIPVIDDTEITNDVTVSNRSGAEARAVLTSGAVSVQPPPAGVGRYRKTVAVNMEYDEQLESRAGWELNKGTIDRRRYQRITLDLLSHPELIADLADMRPGDLITLEGADPDVVKLHVLSFEWSIRGYPIGVVLTCLPADAWAYGEYDDTAARYDSASTILLGPVDSTQTSFRVTSALSEPVSTTATDFDVVVAGERMTIDVSAVTAVTTDATLVAGTFESGVTGWDGYGGTIAQSNTFAQAGTWSARLTVTGTPTQAYIRPSLANCPQVVPGNRYTLSAYVRVAVNQTDVRATIDWLDADGNWFAGSDSGAAGLTSAAGWVQRTVTGEAPDGAVYAMYGTTILSNPSTGALLYTDTVTFTSAERAFQTVTVTRSVNGVVKSHTAGSQMSLADPVRYA